MFKIIKIGGNIVDNPEKLDAFLRDMSLLEGPKLLVHGGGKIATSVSKALGINTQMINGRRVTDSETIRVVTMVYAGLINKTIVNKLNAYGCPAIGLCGADGGLIVSERRYPEPVDFGFVGDPVDVNTKLVDNISAQGYTLVVAPITTDGEGGLLNTNADTVAQSLAVALAGENEVELVYCFEKQGVLMNVEDEDSVIPELNMVSFDRLRDTGAVADGMLPKLENAFEALSSGVKSVVICSAENLLKEGYGGTTIK